MMIPLLPKIRREMKMMMENKPETPWKNHSRAVLTKDF